MKIAVSALRPTFLLIVRLVVIVTVPLFASTSHALTASADVPMRDPWVPADTRKAAAAAPAPVATSGTDLQKQVERKLKQSFDAALINSDGTLTAAQADAAGLGFVVKHFNEIDQRKLGVVRFEDVTRFMNSRGARLN